MHDTKARPSPLPVEPTRRAVLGSALATAVGGLLPAGQVMAASTAAPAAGNDTVVIAIDADSANLDASTGNSGESKYTAWQIFDSLYRLNDKGGIEPSLASGYEKSADGLEYRFQLNTGIKFHDGSPFSSEDVKFSLERVLDPATKSARRPNFVQLIKSVEAPNPTTVVFKLTKPDGIFINKIANYLFIVPKKHVQGLASPEDFKRAPIGTGPYRFVERTIGRSITLERFDDYAGSRPGVRRLVFRVIPEASSRVNALLAGEVDLAVGLPSPDVARLKATPNLAVQLAAEGNPRFIRLYSNVPGTPLSNPKVRLALTYAVDREAIIKSVLNGIGEPMPTILSRYYPIGVDPQLKPRPYDPARAKALLREAGYPNGFELALNASSTRYPKEIPVAVATYWSAIGVKTKVQLLDAGVFNRIENNHLGGPASITECNNALFDPAHVYTNVVQTGSTWSDYSNAEVDRLLDKVEPISDLQARDEIFRQITRILYEDGQAIPITEIYGVFGKKSRLDWTPRNGIAWLSFRTLAWRDSVA